MIDSVENSYSEYQQLVFFREDLKDLLTLTLGFVLLLSLLAAIYGAFRIIATSCRAHSGPGCGNTRCGDG